jgi:hypothetical protein
LYNGCCLEQSLSAGEKKKKYNRKSRTRPIPIPPGRNLSSIAHYLFLIVLVSAAIPFGFGPAANPYLSNNEAILVTGGQAGKRQRTSGMTPGEFFAVLDEWSVTGGAIDGPVNL